MNILNKKTISAMLSCLLVSSSMPNLLAGAPQVQSEKPKSSNTSKKSEPRALWAICVGAIATGGACLMETSLIAHQLKLFLEKEDYHPVYKSDSVRWLETCYYARNDEERSIAKSKYIDCVWRNIHENFSNYHDNLQKFIKMIVTQDCKFTFDNTPGVTIQSNYLFFHVMINMIKNIDTLKDPSLSMNIQDFCKSNNAEQKFKNIMETIINNIFTYKKETLPKLNKSLDKIMENDKNAKANGRDTIENIFVDTKRFYGNVRFHPINVLSINEYMYKLMNLKTRIENALVDEMFKNEFKELCNELENYGSQREELEKMYNKLKKEDPLCYPNLPKEKLSESRLNISNMVDTMTSQIIVYDNKNKLTYIIDYFHLAYIELLTSKYFHVG